LSDSIKYKGYTDLSIRELTDYSKVGRPKSRDGFNNPTKWYIETVVKYLIDENIVKRSRQKLVFVNYMKYQLWQDYKHKDISLSTLDIAEIDSAVLKMYLYCLLNSDRYGIIAVSYRELIEAIAYKRQFSKRKQANKNLVKDKLKLNFVWKDKLLTMETIETNMFLGIILERDVKGVTIETGHNFRDVIEKIAKIIPEEKVPELPPEEKKALSEEEIEGISINIVKYACKTMSAKYKREGINTEKVANLARQGHKYEILVKLYDYCHNQYIEGNILRKDMNPARIFNDNNMNDFLANKLTFEVSAREIETKAKIKLVMDALNYITNRTGPSLFPINGTNSEFARYAVEHTQGYSVEDIIFMVYRKQADWKGKKFEAFVRPKTLFKRGNFDDYMVEKIPSRYSSQVTRNHIIENILSAIGGSKANSKQEIRYHNIDELVNEDKESLFSEEK